jgi:hypothetical protein
MNENGKIMLLHKKDCAFVRNNIRLTLRKLPHDGEHFKAVWLALPRSFLRKFYRTIDRLMLPADAQSAF